MTRPTRIPFATWIPSANHGFTDGLGMPIKMDGVKAWFIHSADSLLMADPPQRLLVPSSNPGSTHEWIRGDGHLFQLVELDEPAWGNGVDYNDPRFHRSDGWQSPNRIVRTWYETRRNPNLDCHSTEITGQGVSRGAAFSKPTEAQIATFARLAEWKRKEGWIDANAENLILHRMVQNTACPDGRFTPEELAGYLSQEDDMTPAEVQALIDQRLDATVGLTLLALLEQMLGIQPSTFDATNQERVNAILARLEHSGIEDHQHIPGGVA